MVRGPKTQSHLLKLGIPCPEHYGEPGLLFSHFYPEYRIKAAIVGKNSNKILFVPNLNDSELLSGLPPSVSFVNPQSKLQSIFNAIAGSSLVIASSLHGIVLAESLGIPARIVASFNEPSFKYEDYLLGSGRNEGDFSFYSSVRQALAGDDLPPPVYSVADMLMLYPIEYL